MVCCPEGRKWVREGKKKDPMYLGMDPVPAAEMCYLRCDVNRTSAQRCGIGNVFSRVTAQIVSLSQEQR